MLRVTLTFELFFKWIKQHLRIKRFYGNSTNAVKTLDCRVRLRAGGDREEGASTAANFAQHFTSFKCERV
jgi:hypothetical protein